MGIKARVTSQTTRRVPATMTISGLHLFRPEHQLGINLAAKATAFHHLSCQGKAAVPVGLTSRSAEVPAASHSPMGLRMTLQFAGARLVIRPASLSRFNCQGVPSP